MGQPSQVKAQLPGCPAGPDTPSPQRTTQGGSLNVTQREGALPPEPGWPVDAPVTGTGALAALRPRYLLGQSLIEQSVNSSQGLRGTGPRVLSCRHQAQRGGRRPGSERASLPPKRAEVRQTE